LRKAEELARRSAAFEALLPNPRPHARVREDDATELSTLQAESIDSVVTSPPYAATYDYLTHHALRLRWLNLDASRLADRELGPRRKYNALDPREAELAWVAELSRFFSAAARVVKPRGAVVVLLADSESNGHALRGEVLAATAARQAQLRPIARASQQRPHFHDQRAFADAPRREHALYFQRR
jgi:tRNA G10  N-methylase Trm11